MVDRAEVVAAARRLEDELIEASQRISRIGEPDTLAGWLVEVLKRDADLARQFALPTEARVKRALLVMLEASSELRIPLVTLLAQRTAAFIATIHDVARHPQSSDRVRGIEANVRVVEGLLARYELNYDRRKTIGLVAEALREHRTHIYKVSPQESDLRVALRAFYEDRTRDDVEAIATLLEYVLSELVEDVRRPGHLAQPRHAWWAVQTLFHEAPYDWLIAKRTTLNKVIGHLLSRPQYSPSRDLDYTSFVPELYSAQNEALWVAINGLKILGGDRAWLLTERNAAGIVRCAASAVNEIVAQNQPFRDLKLTQSRLILLYEMLRYQDLQAMVEIVGARALDLRAAAVGRLYYTDAVAGSVADVKRRIEGMLADGSGWSKGMLSSMLVSGGPGQGKSELASQIAVECGHLAERAGAAFESCKYAVGNEITCEADLAKAIEGRPRDEAAIRCLFFDEVDKAGFDFFAPFLTLLEAPTNGDRTIWIFAQSAQPTFEALRGYAEELETKSLRDFLTRMLLGRIDVPDLRRSPMQKVLSAIGMAKAKHAALRAVQRELVLDLTQRSGLSTNRDILLLVQSEYEVRDGVMCLRGPNRFMLDHYRRGSRRMRANATPLPVRT